ncbi:hypothetical protein FEM48_Zijuj01G0119500 [Ziziphus jujuba var. spinosa]|uniref:Uncharacterized protein n=1 Tax=Ziziphus jujuba var. spinosa TaxID=714518 RepID=A0A978W146_ZIZJJ|nr:hypothetical protein FEM48_Zijuj01G0119500 [Ziziphus jujuba var. spinosa]
MEVPIRTSILRDNQLTNEIAPSQASKDHTPSKIILDKHSLVHKETVKHMICQNCGSSSRVCGQNVGGTMINAICGTHTLDMCIGLMSNRTGKGCSAHSLGSFADSTDTPYMKQFSNYESQVPSYGHNVVNLVRVLTVESWLELERSRGMKNNVVYCRDMVVKDVTFGSVTFLGVE